MTLDFATLRGMDALVTGHTGFKGSWLAIWLHALGVRVSGYSLAPPTNPSNFQASQVRSLLARHIEADIRDAAQITAAVREAKPQIIFHLAAQSLVRLSYQQPRETFDTNVMGTASVLDAVRAAGRPCVVLVITSDKCYENREQVWGYRESDPMGGYDPYSASKGCAELLTAAYRRSFFPPDKLASHGIKLASVRAGNVIGGGDWATDRILTDAAAALAAGKPIPVRNPGAVRPWQHVLEALAGYLTLASRMVGSDDPALCTAWNFGPYSGQEATVRQVVEMFIQSWGDGKWEDKRDPNASHEAAVLRLSIDKAICALAWRPRWNLAKTLQHTAAWYRGFYRDPNQNMREACLADIDAYQRCESDSPR